MKKIYSTFIIFIFCVSPISAQSVDIAPYLSMVEKGNIGEAKNNLSKLTANNSNDLNVLFLEALLTEDGNEAINKYLSILAKGKEFEYSDAVIFKVFSYYYSLGIYKKAGNYLAKLKSEYPNSAYIKLADRKIPDEEIENFETIISQSPQTASEKSSDEHDKDSEFYKYTIQAGAFLSKNNARTLSAKFIDEGQHSEIQIKDIGGSMLNVVKVGKFKDQSEAKKYLEHLKAKYNLSGRIIDLK